MELRKYQLGPNECDRKFPVKGDYSHYFAPVYEDGSGFVMPDDSSDTPISWAIID
ncbi:MAG: hypothetical protein QM500_12260 [Methylococcales bacterium]